MKTLIIYAHPGSKGHCTYTLERVKRQLDKQRAAYELIDLYKIGYDPVLHPEEHYTSGSRNITQQNAGFQKKIKKAKHLIFIHPVWWGSMPAILKGFVDRVFTTHFAFKYKPFRFSLFGVEARPVGLLTGKKAAIFLSTGAVVWASRLMQPQAYSHLRNVLSFIGIKPKVFLVGGAQVCNAKQKKKIRKNVSEGLGWLY